MKSNSIKFWVAGMLLLVSSIFFYACKKDSVAQDDNVPAGSQRFSVYLTDGPYDYQQVLVDIQGIAVKVDTCRRNGDEDHDQPGCDEDHDHHNSDCEIWDTLDIRSGIYDVLTLRNGVDSLLASSFILNGKIERIKFTLGDNNSVLVDSVVHPLQLVNNQHFVYVNIRREHLDSLSSNNFQLFLDFDLSHSIRYFGGEYWLKPVLKPFSLHGSGEIEGRIRPDHSAGVVKAFNATDTAYAIPGHDGEFKIRGLHGGTYSLYVDGQNGYQDTTINNITVTLHHETDIGSIQLHP